MFEPLALPPLRNLLTAHGLTADKQFGQHFLLDANVTDKIIRLSEISPGDRVLEVGPGPGGLTRSLLAAGACVVAVEKDPRFTPILDALASVAEGRLTVVGGDARQIPIAALFPGEAPYEIVANLPYNVGTALLIAWLTGSPRPRTLTLMFQKEVALRIVAATDAPAYGRLAVLAQSIARCDLVMTLPARAFTPPPKVDSAVVRLELRPNGPSPNEIKALERVTAAAFGQRRKMLRSSLKVIGGDALCAAANVDCAARAETIDLVGFSRLACALIARESETLGE